MPHYRIRMINADFESCAEAEYSSAEAAAKAAITAATQVAAEAIADGKTTTAIELRIEEGDRVIAHHVVNLSVSKLLPTD
jgi:uncharacterized protein YcnI